MNYKELNGISIREGFNKFHEQNPRVFEMFKHTAFSAVHEGKKKISAKMIINVIRWEWFMTTNDDNFKINDAYGSYYARLFVDTFPQHVNLFEFRKLRNEEKQPYMEVDDKGILTFL